MCMKLISERTGRKTIVERVLGEDTLAARVATDVVGGVTKGLLILGLVAGIHYARLKTQFEYVPPPGKAPVTLSRQAFDCMTCHNYDSKRMENYQPR